MGKVINYTEQILDSFISFEDPGYIYFLRSDVNGHSYYKIGKAKYREKRYKDYPVKAPIPSILYCDIYSNGYTFTETRLHKIFKEYNIEGEWFELNDFMLSSIFVAFFKIYFEYIKIYILKDKLWYNLFSVSQKMLDDVTRCLKSKNLLIPPNQIEVIMEYVNRKDTNAQSDRIYDHVHGSTANNPT